MTDRAGIRRFVSAAGARFVDLLKAGCKFPSLPADPDGLAGMADWLEGALIGVGASVSRLAVPGAPPVVLGEIAGTCGPGGRTLMIYNHYDVQPVDPLDLWDTPPFAADERDGRVFARGVADNKGDLIARICALEAYREVLGPLPFNVKFLVEGEEETGSAHFDELCQRHGDRLHADHCVWEGWRVDHDGRPELVYGCKGLLYVELHCRKLAYDQHSSQAVYAPSAAWRVVQALACLRDGEGRVTIPGFYDRIVAPGVADAAVLAAIPFEQDAELARLGADAFVDGLRDDDLREALVYNPTANIAGFLTGFTERGTAKTVLPAEAMAKLDFRLVPEQDAAEIAARLREHLDRNGFSDVDTVVMSEENPSRSPAGTALGRAIEAEAEAWFGRPPGVWPLMPATGPMYPIARGLGIPICSPPGVTRPDSAIHAPNEHVRISDFLNIVGYTVAYLAAYGGEA